MPASPPLVLVDRRSSRRAAVCQRALSLAVGAGLLCASATPFLLGLRR